MYIFDLNYSVALNKVFTQFVFWFPLRFNHLWHKSNVINGFPDTELYKLQ